MEPTILIEKTVKSWKRLELLALGLLLPMLIAGLVLMSASLPPSPRILWSVFAGFCTVKIMAWYYHG